MSLLGDRKDYSHVDMVTDLREAKLRTKLTYEQLASKVGLSEVYVAAVMHGQQTLSEDEATRLLDALAINDDRIKSMLTEPPLRGQLMEMPPRDPTLYRFYEMLLVYGPAWKALIHEKCGDGIMSAIDFKVDFKTEGERIQILLDGKFLPYKKF